MSLDAATILGSLAGIASMISFMPQAVKIIRSRDTSGISTWMYIVTIVGFSLWTAYGVAKTAWPIVASNSVCLILSAFILAMKLLSGPQTDGRSATAKAENGKRRQTT